MESPPVRTPGISKEPRHCNISRPTATGIANSSQLNGSRATPARRRRCLPVKPSRRRNSAFRFGATHATSAVIRVSGNVTPTIILLKSKTSVPNINHGYHQSSLRIEGCWGDYSGSVLCARALRATSPNDTSSELPPNWRIGDRRIRRLRRWPNCQIWFGSIFDRREIRFKDGSFCFIDVDVGVEVVTTRAHVGSDEVFVARHQIADRLELDKAIVFSGHPERNELPLIKPRGGISTPRADTNRASLPMIVTAIQLNHNEITSG